MDYIKFRRELEQERRFTVVYWAGLFVLLMVVAAIATAALLP